MQTFLIYDLIATSHIILSYYGLLELEQKSSYQFLTMFICLTLGATLFIWTLITSKTQNLALINKADRLITNGAYTVARHPFYLSYILIWTSTLAVIDLLPLKITLVYLLAFYYFSAKREEEMLLNGAHSIEYAKYRTAVGMFFPRIKKWIN